MPFDPKTHHRRSIRLKGYDYAQPGAYFITTVTWQRGLLFGDIVGGEMVLNPSGRIVQNAWSDLPRHYPHVEFGAFIIMPNHVHGILVLVDDDGGRGGSQLPGQEVSPEGSPASKGSLPTSETRPYVPSTTAKRRPLPEIIRAFKSFSAQRINALRQTAGIPVWQRNYYEHIIRNQKEMERIASYIESNPIRWEEDEENLTRP
jgi:putative transposase